MALEIEHKALEERNAAYQRMVLHELSCPTCIRKRKSPTTKWAGVTEDSVRTL